MPKEFQQVAQASAASMTDQAKWEELLAKVEGNVINPRMVFEAAIVYRAVAGLEGVYGDVELSGTGTGTGEGPSDAARARIMQIMERRPELSDAMIKLLEQLTSKTDSDPPLPPPQPGDQ
jgi:hypothetical protein